jgi:hypothetical protein
MSEALQVRVSRDGKEFGTYSAQEAVRLLVYGTLKETDFYWHEGMTDWAPLTQLQASESRRQLAEKAARDKQEKDEKAAALVLEKIKAREEAEVAALEATRARLEREVANRFECHCCRAKFNEPKDQGANLGCGLVLIVGSGIIMWITYSVAVDSYRPSPGGIGFGSWLASVSFFIGLSLFTVANLRSPSCPSCESTNFSRPEKSDDRK